MEKLLLFTGNDLQDMTMDEWLEGKAPELHPLVIKWFSEIKKCGMDVQGIFHDNYPIGCVSDAPFAYVNAYTSHVNVGFFYGSELYDRKGILEGTGRRMRHIKLRPGLEVDEEEIVTLLKDAYFDIKTRLGGR